LALEPGTVVAKRYRVQEQLGKGGMGEVFSAEHMRTGRRVAIKVLRAESKTKQSAIERFRREARAAGSISSDFVTQVLDVEDDPEYGIVLVFELLEGESLVERLKRTGPIPFHELWGVVEAVWMGLADAHAAGVIHRDLKPSNVFLEHRKGGLRVKILDFGISKLPKTISTESLTQVGQSLGTFSFMPPEQIGKAKNVDHRADIYACTTLVYQAMSGKLPYKARNVVAMMELKNKSEPRSLGEVMAAPVDATLEAFIARGLARDPNARFQSAIEALAAWRQLRPAGATSLRETDSTADYRVEDDPSVSSEAKTRLMPKPDIPALRARLARGHGMRSGAADASQNGAQLQRQGQRSPGATPQDPPPGEPPATVRDPSRAASAPFPTGVLAADPAATQPPVQLPSGPGIALPSAPLEQRAAIEQPFTDSLSPPPMTGRAGATLLMLFGGLLLMAIGFFAVAIILRLLG